MHVVNDLIQMLKEIVRRILNPLDILLLQLHLKKQLASGLKEPEFSGSCKMSPESLVPFTQASHPAPCRQW